MSQIPDTFKDLINDKTNAFAFLATIMQDNSPQITPVWFNMDGDHVLINSAKGRVKDRNMRSRPQVGVCIPDPKNPYRYLQIRGKVIEITECNAEEHIDALSYKYLGVPNYPSRAPGEVRVIYRIRIEKVSSHG